jgi:hypothetical protein
MNQSPVIYGLFSSEWQDKSSKTKSDLSLFEGNRIAILGHLNLASENI